MRHFRLYPNKLIAWGIFAVIGGGYLWVGLVSPEWFIRLTYEDMYTEWGQLLFFLATSVLAALLAIRGPVYRLFFLCLAIAAFYTVMEEISWGQRLLQIRTPDFFWENNIQEELNIHNLLTGPEDTLLKDSVEIALVTALLSFGLAFPLLLRFDWDLAHRMNSIGIAAPPLYLSPYFIAGAMMELGILNFNEAEVAELLIGIALAFMCGHSFLLAPPYGDLHAPESKHKNSHRLNIVMVVMTLGAGTLATGITRYLYSIPAWEDNFESRITNGMEKYGRRYEFREQWGQAADLYRKVYELQPRPGLLNSVVQAYQMSGNKEAFRFYYRQLMEQTIPQSAYKSADVKIQLSLVESYRRAGLPEKADFHLQMAYRVARRWVQKNQDDAEQVYLLGLTELKLGKNLAAVESFKRAAEIEPENRKYTQALRMAKRNIQ